MEKATVFNNCRKLNIWQYAKKENVMNIDKFVDKKYEQMSLKELVNAPVDAISGVSENDAKLLLEAFNVKTIADFAKLKYVRWAQAICILASGED